MNRLEPEPFHSKHFPCELFYCVSVNVTESVADGRISGSFIIVILLVGLWFCWFAADCVGSIDFMKEISGTMSLQTMFMPPVFVYLSAHVHERARVCMCVCVCVRVRAHVCVCVRARVRVCSACVCGRLSVCLTLSAEQNKFTFCISIAPPPSSS